MPVLQNHDDMNARLMACKDNLNGLFTGLTPSQELIDQLTKIHEYYCTSFDRAVDEDSASDIIACYELYVKNLQAVKSGTMNHQEALEAVSDMNDFRECGIAFYNLATVCEILFWATVLVTSYVAIFSIGVPLLIAQFPIGVIAGIGAIGLMFYAADQFATCFEEFKSMSRLRDETKREQNVISFFKSPTPAREEREEEELSSSSSLVTSQ